MKIEFSTSNIDKAFYEKCILYFIYEHYTPEKINYPKYLEQDKWKIQIKPLEEFESNFYSESEKKNLNYKIPHGVTGKYSVICYIDDNPNNMIMLQNLSVICHELAHMILKINYPSKTVKQRYDDFYSKKGNSRQFFSSEIHDRLEEGKTRKVTIRKNIFSKFNFYAVDILDLV